MNYIFVFVFFVFMLFSCGNSNVITDNENADRTTDAQEQADIDVQNNETIDDETEEGFNSQNPGYSVDFQIMDVSMMGEKQAIAIAYVMETAREDLKEREPSDLAPDSCVFSSETAEKEPECQSDEDCAPEQECLPETDSSGEPEEGTERCVTPDRESLDIGPIIAEGFSGGPKEFLFEPNDSVYKLDGQGDGGIDPALISYATEYTVYAEDPVPDDLGAFSGSVYLPAALELTSHEVEAGEMFPAVTINPEGGVKFTWTPGDEDSMITLTLSGPNGSVNCRPFDDGEFIITENVISKLDFAEGMMAMTNMLTMERSGSGLITGENITNGEIAFNQLFMVNIKLAEK